MNTAIDNLAAVIRRLYPDVELKVVRPKNADGAWFLYVFRGDREVSVEWRPDKGFGVSARADPVYGEGPDEVYESPAVVTARVVALLETREETRPFAERLEAIRRARKVTQEEVARRLGVKQSSVSKLEGRGDAARLRKLQEFFAALGADQMTIQLSFGDGTVAELPLGRLRTGTYG